MSKRTVDIDLLSKEREDVFDEYYNKIEQLRLNSVRSQELDKPNYDLIEKSLTIVERNLDDLGVKDLRQKNIVEIGNSTVLKFLKDWFDIFEQLGDRPRFILDFAYNVIAASSILAKIESLDEIYFRKTLKFLSPTREDRENFIKSISNPIDNEQTRELKLDFPSGTGVVVLGKKSKDIDEIEIIDSPGVSFDNEKENTTIVFVAGHGQVGKELFMSNLDKTYRIDEIEAYRDILAQAIRQRRDKNAFPSLQFNKVEELEIEQYRKLINESNLLKDLEVVRRVPNGSTYEWDIKVTISDGEDKYNSAQIGYLIWVLSEALEKIDGVSVSLEEWGLGSRWFTLKTKINSEAAKEEVKQVLNKSKEALESQYLDKPIEEVKKIKAEREKIEKESENILDKEDAKRIQALQLEKLELENEKLKVNLLKEKVELIRGISQLVVDGIVKNDSNIQIMINDLLFIEKSDSNIIVGDDIEIIEEDEIIKLPEDGQSEIKEENI